MSKLQEARSRIKGATLKWYRVQEFTGRSVIVTGRNANDAIVMAKQRGIETPERIYLQ